MFDTLPLNPSLPVADMDRAKEWFREKLDLKPVDESGTKEGVWYETGDGTAFFLYPSEFAGTNKATAAAFTTGDRFDEAVSFLRSRDVDFLDLEFEGMTTENGIMTAPNGMRGAWFEDSEGNILALSTG